MGERRLTPNQKCALNLVRNRESAQCISGPTWADPYTAFIHYRTAESLRGRGLIAIGPGPDYDITLEQGVACSGADWASTDYQRGREGDHAD